jgi:membrane-bound inhibitor of C-type lysozyme
MRLAFVLAVTALCLAPACSREEAPTAAAAPETAASEPPPVSAGAPPFPAANAGHDYACADGTSFNARIDKGNAVVTVEGNTLTLAHSEQAAGATYSAEGMTFVARGSEAYLARAGSPTVVCTAK